MLFHSRFIEPQYEIIRNKNCQRKKSRIQFIPYQRHPYEQGSNQKYKRNYECKGYSHHAHRRFADHHHPLSYLIGSSCNIRYIYDFVFTIRRRTVAFCATSRTSRRLNDPHRQMRTLYVFHNTQMLYSIIRHFANSTLQIAANLIIICELRSIPSFFST